MPVATVTTSAAGSLALLEDDDKDVRRYALTHLLAIIPTFWAEISEKVAYIELLADPMSKELSSEQRPYAALLCSKIYFYLGLMSEAVEFALQAGKAFQEEKQGEYRETIIAGCLDRAIEETESGPAIDMRLAEIVEDVLRSGQTSNGKLAIGLALSLRRLDLLEMIYVTSRAPNQPYIPGVPAKHTVLAHDEALLRYILYEVVIGTSGNDSWPVAFRNELLSLLLKLFYKSNHLVVDYSSITQIWIQLDDTTSAGRSIANLINSRDFVRAYRVAFDICEFATQNFVAGVRKVLEDEGIMAGNGLMEPSTSPPIRIHQILLGLKSAELYLNFLHRNNKADLTILKGTKEALEDRYSIYHSAITFANAFAHCGTTSDRFLRENLDWLGRASNWAKFSATAALGVIHRGSYVNGIRVVKPYLPGGSAPSKFSEGGALFAFGLIYTGRMELASDELRKHIVEGLDPIIQHGAALGLGVCAISTGDEDIYEDIKNALYQDNATSGEAAGYAMGLVMLGSGSTKALQEMLTYAKETQHEKIIRSLAVGIAFVSYGGRDQANPLIESLMNEKDSILRYGAMFTIAMAHAGTGNNWAIKKLLHVAVSDVADDVRRAAVTALGFVMFRNHTQVPRIVQLLAESYNPHVRHGATLALGISCAGTGLEAAVELLEPMTKDPVDFVRQGAYISLAMILIQQTEASSPRVTAIRELFAKVVENNREDPMARFGASLAQGIIDAGGRNMTLSMSTRIGTNNMKAIVGMAMFVQFWYWFPMAHGLGLAFQPATVIALDGDMRIPYIGFECNAKPSLFAYPSTEKKVKESKTTRAKAAVLSTTAKSQARARSKKVEAGEAMDMDEKPSSEKRTTETPQTTKKDRKPTEPTSFTVVNMTRVLPNQLPHLYLPEPLRFLSSPSNPDSSYLYFEEGNESPRKEDTILQRDGQSKLVSSGIVGSGSIIVVDNFDNGRGPFIKLDEKLWPERGYLAQLGNGQTVVTTPAVVPTEEFEEAQMPQPFEYDFED